MKIERAMQTLFSKLLLIIKVRSYIVDINALWIFI